ncbi:MAG: hypothetical protein ACRC10_04885 [Thermoguttaceae bacterium]
MKTRILFCLCLSLLSLSLLSLLSTGCSSFRAQQEEEIYSPKPEYKLKKNEKRAGQPVRSQKSLADVLSSPRPD